MTPSNGIDPEDYDESAVRVRPHKRGTRPRSKLRPAHADARPGTVIAVDRGRYQVILASGVTVTAARAREMHRHSLVVGDRVHLVGDLSGAAGTLARIVRASERHTVLRRSADDSDTVERVIVANADQMLIVTAAADPEPRPRLIDRYVVAAYDAGISPLLCVTKTDLRAPDSLLDAFSALDLPLVTTRLDEDPSEALLPLLRGHFTVAVGHSGVGKSTLINALVPGAARATGEVNSVTGRGRHTSSSAIALPLPGPDAVGMPGSPGNGWLADTPGVRSFGLGHVDVTHVINAFPELAELATACPRGCQHAADHPECVLTQADTAGKLDQREERRLDSLRRLIGSMSGS